MSSLFSKKKNRWIAGFALFLATTLVAGTWAGYKHFSSRESEPTVNQTASSGDDSTNIVGNQGQIQIEQNSYADRPQTLFRDRGIAAFNNGNPQRAYELLKESAYAHHRDGIYQEEAMDYLQIGMFMLASRDTSLVEDAKKYLDQADDLAAKHGFSNDPDFAVFRANLAQTYGFIVGDHRLVVDASEIVSDSGVSSHLGAEARHGVIASKAVAIMNESSATDAVEYLLNELNQLKQEEEPDHILIGMVSCRLANVYMAVPDKQAASISIASWLEYVQNTLGHDHKISEELKMYCDVLEKMH